jgi:hypothetical protein
MKQNTVLAAVSIGLFLALVFTNIGGDENEQNSSNTKRIQDSPPVIVEDTRYSVDPQSNSGSPTEMAMEQEEWWDNTASSTDRLTEEEMVEMLESLWGPSDLPSPDNNEDVLNAEDIEDEEDFFNTEEPDIMLQDEPKTTNDSNFGRSLTASILTLDVDTDNVDRNTNKAQAITRGGDDTPEVNIPDNSKNLTADDFSPPQSAEVQQKPAEKISSPPKPPVIETTQKPRPAIPETTEISDTRYRDGQYSAVGKYTKNGKSHSFSVALSVINDRVESFSLSPNSSDEDENDIQNVFYNDVSPYIIGEFLANIPQFSSLGGGSQVPVAFHSAISSIRSQASR